jgi:hypothetical protein
VASSLEECKILTSYLGYIHSDKVALFSQKAKAGMDCCILVNMDKIPWAEKVKRAEENRQRAEGLKSKGWVTTGDVPYTLARLIPEVASTTLDIVKNSFLEEILEEQNENNAAYEKENVAKFGGKTYISPDLYKKFEEKIRGHYQRKS